jgi:hypothetical protein
VNASIGGGSVPVRCVHGFVLTVTAVSAGAAGAVEELHPTHGKVNLRIERVVGARFAETRSNAARCAGRAPDDTTAIGALERGLAKADGSTEVVETTRFSLARLPWSPWAGRHSR